MTIVVNLSTKITYNMKKYLFVFLAFLTFQAYAQDNTVLELNPAQSMCITGKGQGQDGAINPYINEKSSIGIVKNLGKNEFSIRIQKAGKIIDEITIQPKEKKEVKLLKGYELYFDTEKRAKVKVAFKKDS